MSQSTSHHSNTEQAPKPYVSVVVPAFNASKWIETFMVGLSTLSKSVFNYEIIIVDDGSTDNTAELIHQQIKAHQLSDVLCHTQANAGPAGARNQGVRLAQGEIVVFLDCDCVVEPDWLNNLIAPFLTDTNDQKLIGVEGKTIADDAPKTPLDHYVENPNGGFYWTCNIAFKRQTLLDIGGFDEGFPWPSGEDIDLAHRIQQHGTIAFAPTAVVRHLILSRALIKHIKEARTFASMIRLSKKHPGLLVPPNPTFVHLLAYQFPHFIFPPLRQWRWLFKNPIVFFKVVFINLGYICLTTWNLPQFYKHFKAPLIIKHGLDDLNTTSSKAHINVALDSTSIVSSGSSSS